MGPLSHRRSSAPGTARSARSCYRARLAARTGRAGRSIPVTNVLYIYSSTEAGAIGLIHDPRRSAWISFRGVAPNRDPNGRARPTLNCSADGPGLADSSKPPYGRITAIDLNIGKHGLAGGARRKRRITSESIRLEGAGHSRVPAGWKNRHTRDEDPSDAAKADFLQHLLETRRHAARI